MKAPEIKAAMDWAAGRVKPREYKGGWYPEWICPRVEQVAKCHLGAFPTCVSEDAVWLLLYGRLATIKAELDGLQSWEVGGT